MTVFNKSEPNSSVELERVLCPVVLEWFRGKFSSFSEPQLFGVLEIHSRKNVLISAPTGSGKTLTGFLSILNELVDSAVKGVLEDKIYAVYVSPLKALNEDIRVNLLNPLSEIEELVGRSLGIRVGVRTGDTSAYEKSKMVKSPPHILITTPESLAISLNSVKFVENLKCVDWCVVDEIHSLAENKRGVHLSLCLERLQSFSPGLCRVGLSATVSPLVEVARFLVGLSGGVERDCVVCDVQFLKEIDVRVVRPVDDLIDVDAEDAHVKTYGLLHDLIQSRRTTLVFTNTRAGTERVIHNLKDLYPSFYAGEVENVGAHHGSLSKEHRHSIEGRLRSGELKVVVSSTSLELGIDIGFIDLVVLLSSPKSVARALQRIGRAGHSVSEVSVGRLVALDRDDLVECSVITKFAVERVIDDIHIPSNCLDVLAQFIFGVAVFERSDFRVLFDVVRRSFCFRDLVWKDFFELLEYLAGRFASLEDRYVYAKIWLDEESGLIGRRGRAARVLYMTNLGTIPDQTFVSVKVGDFVVGKVDEGFVERLKRGDVFVLGGEKYEFLYSRGMVASVKVASHRNPTIPSWFSEMLPLSFDLASGIGKFRRLVDEKFNHGVSHEEVVRFICDYLYVDVGTARVIFDYFFEQYRFASIASDRRIVVESTFVNDRRYFVFHSLFGRRVNDCLSRAVAFVISKSQRKSVEMGINDNGFYLCCDKSVNVLGALELVDPDRLDLLLESAIDRTEILNRRFRHCASRALMILRNYKGKRKAVGRQHVGGIILLNAVKRISKDFCILREARREVLEDLMDIKNTKRVLSGVKSGDVKVVDVRTEVPSPFAFNIVMLGHTDVLRMEDRVEFLKRMHNAVLSRIEGGE